MLHFKDDVDFSVLQPQIVLAIIVADQTNLTAFDTLITSIHDDSPFRVPNSLHKKGLAVDIRSKGHTDPANWSKRIQYILGPQYQVIFEHQGEAREHIHIEFDPKTKTSS